jgi:hypothetical protein
MLTSVPDSSSSSLPHRPALLAAHSKETAHFPRGNHAARADLFIVAMTMRSGHEAPAVDFRTCLRAALAVDTKDFQHRVRVALVSNTFRSLTRLLIGGVHLIVSVTRQPATGLPRYAPEVPRNIMEVNSPSLSLCLFHLYQLFLYELSLLHLSTILVRCLRHKTHGPSLGLLPLQHTVRPDLQPIHKR